jgi:hypothetical protein
VQAGNSQDPFPFRHGQDSFPVRSSEVQAMSIVLNSEKHPGEKLEWGILWEGLEDGEVVQSSSWTVTPSQGITKLSSDYNDSTTWFWAEGGLSRSYKFTNTMVTNRDRRYVRSIVIEVKG